jgi:hypothetical protein
MAGTMRAAVRAAASRNNKVTSESDADTCTISFTSNPPTSQPLISSTLGLRYLIRTYRTGEVRVHGCPVRYLGFRYGTDGLLTMLELVSGLCGETVHVSEMDAESGALCRRFLRPSHPR